MFTEFNQYTQRALKICASLDKDTFIYDFLSEVVTSCKRKVHARMSKCKKAIKSVEDFEFEDEAAAPAGAYWHRKTFGEVVKDYFKRLVAYDTTPHRGGSAANTARLSMEAYLIGSQNRLGRYPMLARRLKKFGDYYGAVQTIEHFLTMRSLVHYQGNITLTEVRPFEPRTVEVTENVVQILNENAERTEYESIEAADFTAKFGIPAPEDGGLKKVKVSSHCELTLALHFYENMKSKKHLMQMGVSKGCCWLCEQFLDTLSRQDPQIIVEVTQNQGKIHSGWGMPDETPPAVAEKMLKIIEHKMCNIQSEVLAHRLFMTDTIWDSELWWA